MTEKRQIRECYPPPGDWFEVTRMEGGWYIERVLMLALVDAEGQDSQILPVLGTGLLEEDDAYTEWYIVFGAETSPAGPTWKEIYDSGAPTGLTVREIIAEMGPAGLGSPGVWSSTQRGAELSNGRTAAGPVRSTRGKRRRTPRRG
jgi:hypothetical protein